MRVFNPVAIARSLRRIGLMGIGERNADYVLLHNQRKFYPRVDDKLITKKLALAAFSLGGQPDHLLVEYCVQFDPIFDQVSFRGVPDIRIIVFFGYPVMAMIRLPTRMSDGKANLHQGAIGVGIDLPSGLTRRGVWGTELIREHPDTEHSIVGMKIPHWEHLLQMAASCYELSELGYVGVDFVLDRTRGPLMLELNARPGLAIQMANGNGLLHRLRRVEALKAAGALSSDPQARARFAQENFATLG